MYSHHVQAIAAIGNCEKKEIPLEKVFTKDLKIDDKNGLNLNELAKKIEAKSLRSIREKLAGIIGDIFAYLKEMFQHIKKIFYIVSVCMMIHDGYK